MLIDVVERSVAGRLKAGPAAFESFISEAPVPAIVPGESTSGQILAIVVLKGTLIAARKPVPPEERGPLTLPLPPTPPAGPIAFELPAGVYARGSGPLTEIDLGSLRLEPPAGEEVDVLVVSSGLTEAPAAAWGLDPHAIHMPELHAIVSAQQRPDLIWLGARIGSRPIWEALLHALGGRVGTDYPNEQVLLLILDKNPQFLWWNKITKRFEAQGPKKDPLTADTLYSYVGGPHARGRIFVLNPINPLMRPSELGDLRFDRMIYMTDDIPSQLPSQAFDILRAPLLATDAGTAHLSSFLPVVSRDTGYGQAKLKKFKIGRLRRKGIKLKAPNEEMSETFMACLKDSSNLPFESALLQNTWNTWQSGGGTAQTDSFLTVAVGAGALSNDILGSWGRAVMNRRVGVACSGGGASAYRIGPVLEEMEAKGLPIDVFAGLSGSALMGAFYSRYGMTGFNFARDLGPYFQLTLPLVLLWTQPYEWVVDCLLEGARVEDLGIRFAAVAAALPEETPPTATVVVHGTLGEAVRVSGSLPPSFAPSDKDGIRYTDGGASTAVPAQVARDCGADIVLACNVIPGPKRGNPYSVFPLGWLVRKTPIVGRFVDNYTWYAFFMDQTSREFGAAADVFIEWAAQDFPLLESVAFIAATLIIDDAKRQQKTIVDNVDLLLKKWQTM